METVGATALLNLAAVAGLMTLGWCVSLARRNVTVVDTLWGLGFVFVALINTTPSARGMPAAVCWS